MISKSLSHLALWALPMRSNRRFIARTVKQALLAPGRISSRINLTNISNFLHYRRRTFYCPICGQHSRPLYDFPDLALRREHKIGALRETLQCRHCLASLRQRALALSLLDNLHDRTSIRHPSISALARAGLNGIRVLDSDNFSAMSAILRDDPSYFRCSYLPDKDWGDQISTNYFNINLEKIDFGDASFDVVLTSDVMEHVRDSKTAHAEISRILRPSTLR